MAASNKQPEISLNLRFAEADYLVKCLEALKDDEKKSVTYTGLYRQLTIIRDHWLKMERDRKARQNTILRRKSPNKL
jgi:hypothetical protein